MDDTAAAELTRTITFQDPRPHAAKVHSTLPVGVGYTSLEIKISYLRPISATTGTVTAHGWVTRSGRRAAFAEADLQDNQGKVLATASSSCLIVAADGARP